MSETNLLDVLKAEYESIHGPLPKCIGDDAAMNDALHEKEQRALCLSGGGIRSATFALGVIQAFARGGRKSLLTQFDYLSTVSGGGYIGAWLSAYARRAGGIAEVAKELVEPPRDPRNPQLPQVRHLRRFSNYLTPRLALLSGDTWTLLGTYLRNLALTWITLVPLLVVMLAVVRVLVLAYQWRDAPPEAVIGAALIAFIAYGMAILYLADARPVGRTPRFRRLVGKDALPYLTNGRFVWRAVAPLVVCGVGLTLAHSWMRDCEGTGWIGIVFSVLALLLTFFGSLMYMERFAEGIRRGEETGNRRPGVTLESFLFKKRIAEVGSACLGTLVFVGMLYLIVSRTRFDATTFTPIMAPKADDWLSGSAFPIPNVLLYVCFAVPLFIGGLFASASVFIAGSSWFNEEFDREWWARCGAWCAIAAVVWIGITVLSIFGPVFIYYAPRTITGVGMITGGFAVLMGRSAKTAANSKEKEEQQNGWRGKSLNFSLGLAVPVFAICVLAGLSLATTKLLEPWTGAAAIANRSILERSSWTLEKKEVRPPDAPIKDFDRTTKSIEMPRFEGDTFAAREHLYVIGNTPGYALLILIVIGAVLVYLGSLFVGVNRFSMNALYRNRLVRAYLGASNADRRPNPFTGFDPDDNLQMDELRRDSVYPCDICEGPKLLHWLETSNAALGILLWQCLPAGEAVSVESRLAEGLSVAIANHDLTSPFLTKGSMSVCQRIANRKVLEKALHRFLRATGDAPFHIVNMALNLVNSNDLAWQERKATSFTASALHCGSDLLGYRPTALYGGPSGMSLGMATSISGAAASPNMGYHSSPALSFLLALFNVRLGAWLGNPGEAGDQTFDSQNPKYSLTPLMAEVFGDADDQHPYVYLSDGGHFENLGLYEMVRRRCHSIVVCDAGEDQPFAFDDLGNAIRKIRIDLGIPIVIKNMLLYPRPKPGDKDDQKNPKYCAYGTIKYTEMDHGPNAKDGVFVYIKPAFYGRHEPKDIYNYARSNPAFPHESTLGDQFFSESQFESYRSLGEYVILDEICNRQVPSTIEKFIAAAQTYVDRDA